MNRSPAVPGPCRGLIDVGARAGADHSTRPLEDPLREYACLALAGLAENAPVLLHGGERPLAELGPAEAEGVAMRAAEVPLPPGQRGPRTATALGGGQAGPLDGQLRQGGEAVAGPEVAGGAPPHGPGPVGVERPAGQVEAPEQNATTGRSMSTAGSKAAPRAGGPAGGGGAGPRGRSPCRRSWSPCCATTSSGTAPARTGGYSAARAGTRSTRRPGGGSGRRRARSA